MKNNKKESKIYIHLCLVKKLYASLKIRSLKLFLIKYDNYPVS